MRKFIALIFIFQLVRTNACELSPQSILADLNSKGSAEVINRLWDDGACETAFFRGLKSGATDWIKVAVALRPHTDAWYSESLEDSLGTAMQIAPRNVLPLVGAGFDKSICLPWMMDDSGQSDEKYRQIIIRAEPMFKSLLGSNLDQQARECLTEVEEAKRGPLFQKKVEPQPAAAPDATRRRR